MNRPVISYQLEVSINFDIHNEKQAALMKKLSGYVRMRRKSFFYALNLNEKWSLNENFIILIEAFRLLDDAKCRNGHAISECGLRDKLLIKNVVWSERERRWMR